jgi:chitodextrinase
MTSQPAATRFGHRIALAAACAALVFLAGCPGSKSGDTSDTTPPGAPSALGASPVSGAQINLAWTAATDDVGVSGYRVERCQGASCSTFAQIATPTGTSYNDTGLTDATSYSYRVRATDAAGNLGAYSNTASAATLDATPPTAPSNLSATPASQTQINLTWTAATDNVGVTGYRVERCQGASCSTFAQIATPSATSFNDTGLTAGTSYSYQVRAVDAASNLGAFSSVASATTLPPTPASPTGVSATPGNTQLVLSWPAVPGATSYNVYSSLTDPATVSGTKTTVLTPGATLSPLTNGTPIFAAVTAVNAGGESGLSSGVCAVPTAADQTGVTLYDPLCGDSLDGQKWSTPQFTRGVAGGAMVLSTQADNMESRQVKFISYQTLTNVNISNPNRVTTLQADINVPQASASRTGEGQIRAALRLSYQPPSLRLNFPGGNQDQIAAEFGLADTGGGMRAYAAIRHSDNASGTVRSVSGITFTDPPGFSVTTFIGERDAAAAYDTTYTVKASLNEATNVLTWTIAGGTFGAGVTGTADLDAYVSSGPASWTALPTPRLGTGGGFLSALVGTRTLDESASGGGSGKLVASLDNVQVGVNGGAAGPYDNFDGPTGGNSGPAELAPPLWTVPGAGNVFRDSSQLAGGSLVGHVQGTTSTPVVPAFSAFQFVNLNNPGSVGNTLQADVNATTCSNDSASAGHFNTIRVQGNFFNDGTSGAQANSNTGEVRAFLNFDCGTGLASFTIFRINSNGSFTTVNSASNSVPVGSAPATGAVHTMRVKWDNASHSFTFRMDDATPVVVDPTVASAQITNPVTVAGASNSPLRQIVWGVSVPPGGTPPQAASLDVKMNNVFTGP